MCGYITSRKSIEKCSTWLIDISGSVYIACFDACMSINNAISMNCFGP